MEKIGRRGGGWKNWSWEEVGIKVGEKLGIAMKQKKQSNAIMCWD